MTAIDFNPAHIAAARSLATEAGIDNVTFLEADLATLMDDPAAAAIPEVDVVSVHGVWSWVPDAVRAASCGCWRRRSAPGGVGAFSYNALPGWQAASGCSG